jgi:hypothetical protein
MPHDDDKLKSRLKAARGATSDAPHRFALVLRGEKGILLVDKKKISAKDINDARKELGGATVVSGRCFSDDGEGALVFESNKPWASAASAMVKRLAKPVVSATLDFRQGSGAEEAEAEDEEADTQTVPKAPPVPVTANTTVPVLDKPVRIVLATAVEWQKQAAALKHPKLQQTLTRDADYLVGLLKKGELSGIHRTYGALEQKMSDTKVLPEIVAELARIAPVAKGHSDPKAKETFATAQSLYDDGDLLSCRGMIAQFTARYGHAPYAEKAEGESKAMTDFVAKVGTLADGYEKAKSELEKKIDKVLADTKKFSQVADEAKALKAFFAKTATLGLRKQIKDVETEADAAKRKQKVEKAILAVQAYLNAGEQQIKGNALSIDYFRMLRHLHAELSKKHH